jgi:hypothetical protein
VTDSDFKDKYNAGVAAGAVFFIIFIIIAVILFVVLYKKRKLLKVEESKI